MEQQLLIPQSAQSLVDGMPHSQVIVPWDQLIEMWESKEGDTTWYVVGKYMDVDIRVAVCYIASGKITYKAHCYVWALERIATCFTKRQAR
jgi:hypothetical protein